MNIKVYIMHSEKGDYKNNIYKPLLEIGLMKDYFLILPLSERFKATYIKDLMLDSDLIICDLSNYNIFLKYEIKMAKKLNKNIYYFINDKDKKINKFKDIQLNIYNDSKDFSNKVKLFLDGLDRKSILLKRENIYCLGNITK